MSIAWWVVVISAGICIGDSLFLTFYCHLSDWDKQDYSPLALPLSMTLLFVAAVTFILALLTSLTI